MRTFQTVLRTYQPCVEGLEKTFVEGLAESRDQRVLPFLRGLGASYLPNPGDHEAYLQVPAFSEAYLEVLGADREAFLEADREADREAFLEVLEADHEAFLQVLEADREACLGGPEVRGAWVLEA